jgi:diketogulonate reductase-like aldo/keto reductase
MRLVSSMVKITKASRRRMIEETSPFTGNKYVNRNFLHFFLVVVVGLAVTVYFVFLSTEQKAHVKTVESKTTLTMAAPRSASSILASGKPFLMYGTAWKKEHTAMYVEQAVTAGFRFIDTACQPKHYNEKGVGAGWTAAAKKLGLDRSYLFLQTKFTPIGGQDPNRVPYDKKSPLEEQVQNSLKVSLTNLQTQYLDSLVLHSPLDTLDDTLRVWRQFEDFVDSGKVLRLGISNCYDYHTFTSLYEQARIKPSILQNRFYKDSNFDTELRVFCKANNIWYQSFWTLTASRDALDLPSVKELAASKALTAQGLMYAFLMSLGYPKPLSGTTSLQHMAEDVALMERMQDGEKIFESEDDLRRFAQLLGMPDL